MSRSAKVLSIDDPEFQKPVRTGLRTALANALRWLGLEKDALRANLCCAQLKFSAGKDDNWLKRIYCGLRTCSFCAHGEADKRVKKYKAPQVAALATDGMLTLFNIQFPVGATVETFRQTAAAIREFFHDYGLDYISQTVWHDGAERMRVLVFGELRALPSDFPTTYEIRTIASLEDTLKQLLKPALPDTAKGKAELELRWKGLRVFVTSRGVEKVLRVHKSNSPNPSTPNSQVVYYDQLTGEIIPYSPRTGALATSRSGLYYQQDLGSVLLSPPMRPYYPTKSPPRCSPYWRAA